MTRLLWTATVAAALAAGHAATQAPLSAPVEHFKYASVGIEQEEGLPYWIWQALPRLFPDLLPGGYGALGFVWEPGRELPVGFSKRDVLGTSRVAVNCAFCHTATYRRSPDACASCHDAEGDRLGAVIPIDEIGTDRHRLDTWTAASAAAFNGLAAGQSWQPRGYRKTNGYVAMPLAGVWLNAPYLHNGSVPTLVDLLEPAERRPRRFVRGYDVYDPRRVGFVAGGDAAEREGTPFDTSLPGNGSGGHLYGTDLPPDEKVALVEYLKTR